MSLSSLTQARHIAAPRLLSNALAGIRRSPRARAAASTTNEPPGRLIVCEARLLLRLRKPAKEKSGADSLR